MPTVSEVFAPPPSDLPPEMVGERSLLVRRLLELAREQDQLAAHATQIKRHQAAGRCRAKGAAYYHAAHLLGWHMIGEGDTPVELQGEELT